MTFELKGVLEEFRKRKPHIEVQKTPDVYVDNRATPNEVQDWLLKKNFSERVRKQFDGVDGEKLFSLSKDQLKSFCGEEEGNRLFSQITIQRNISGYKTVNTNELKRILSEQRKRVESDDIEDVSKQFSYLQDYDKSEKDSNDDEEEVIVVRKPKKATTPSAAASNSSPAKKKKKKPAAAAAAPRAAVAAPKPAAPKPKSSSASPGSGHKKKKKEETGTLKDQIKKQRMKIIYKTDDDE